MSLEVETRKDLRTINSLKKFLLKIYHLFVLQTKKELKLKIQHPSMLRACAISKDNRVEMKGMNKKHRCMS